MTARNVYAAFGLRIRSEISLPHFIRLDSEDYDVDIGFGEAERPGRGSSFRGWEALPGQFFIDIPDIARMLVRSGASILIDAAPEVTERELVMHVQGSAFAALLQQRHMLPLHACAVETDRGALVVMGSSGAGKSTTLAALTERGFRMLADDVTAIAFADDGAPVVVPGFPATRLWEDSVRVLRPSADTLDPVREGLAKYYLPVSKFRSEPMPLHAIAVLGEHNGDQALVAPLGAEERCAWLLQLVFRKKFMNGMGLQQFRFQAVTRIARSARAIRLLRPQEPFDPHGLVNRLTSHFEVQPASEGG